MAKYLTALFIALFACVLQGHSQADAIKIPAFSGNVNDWGSLFTDGQKSRLDSACTVFTYQTNIPIALITFGAVNTTKESSAAFIDKTDSILYTNNNGQAEVAIFLSKEYRALSFKANTPANDDTTKNGEWRVKLQQIFTASVQPNIPLLKDGKYADALISIIGDLAVGVKKEF
jgi:hypothetical protein